MDTITIQDLEVYAGHGVFSEERTLGQKFLISLSLLADLQKAAKSDDLSGTINYGEVCEKTVTLVKENHFLLIETLAETIAERLLLDFYPLLSKISVTVKKPWAPIGFPLDTVSVKIERGWHKAYLSIGSNLGDRKAYLDSVKETLLLHPLVRNVVCSSYIETKPFGVTDQPDFLNGAVSFDTTLTPYELLDLAHEMEQKAKRVRERFWGPRTLDVDILYYDDLILDDEKLTIPHPQMVRRLFVLKPLSEIAPQKRHPVTKQTTAEQLFLLLKEEQ